jgi:hypothetical protein
MFKIHGIERRILKKELSNLKLFVKDFWHFHQLDKDMSSFFGNHERFPMSDNDAEIKFNDANAKIIDIQNKLIEKLLQD